MIATFGPEDFAFARILANKLIETCSPNDYWDELEQLTPAQYAALDSIVFECHICNHWFEQRENATPKASQWTCRDCV